MTHMFDPYKMLVGRVGQAPYGVPGGGTLAAPPGGGMVTYNQPWAPPGMTFGPPDAGCPPFPVGCYPLGYCPPQSPGFYSQTGRAALSANAPQTGLGLNTVNSQPGTPVGAGLPRTITVAATVPMCLTDWRVSRSSAPDFTFSSIKIARIEYASDGQEMPCDAFAPDSLKPPLRLPQLYPGTPVSVTITNRSDEDKHFFSIFYGFPGPSCEPCL